LGDGGRSEGVGEGEGGTRRERTREGGRVGWTERAGEGGRGERGRDGESAGAGREWAWESVSGPGRAKVGLESGPGVGGNGTDGRLQAGEGWDPVGGQRGLGRTYLNEKSEEWVVGT
jgi:hypothetical protein